MRFQDDLITRFHWLKYIHSLVDQIFAFILASSGSENNPFIKNKSFKWYCLAIRNYSLHLKKNDWNKYKNQYTSKKIYIGSEKKTYFGEKSKMLIKDFNPFL